MLILAFGNLIQHECEGRHKNGRREALKKKKKEKTKFAEAKSHVESHIGSACVAKDEKSQIGTSR